MYYVHLHAGNPRGIGGQQWFIWYIHALSIQMVSLICVHLLLTHHPKQFSSTEALCTVPPFNNTLTSAPLNSVVILELNHLILLWRWGGK